MADDDIVVVFDDAADTGAGEGADKGNGGKNDDPDLVKDLKSQLSTMRTTAAAATQRATTAEQRAQQIAEQSTKQVNESRADTIESGIAAAKAAADAAELAYVSAFEAGDAKAIAKAQREISSAEARKVHLEQAKANLEEMPTRRAAPRVDIPAAAPTDPLEAWIHNGGMVRSPETAAWARQHRDVVLNPQKLAKLTAAHYDAEGEGIQVDTPEYFRHVEKYIGLDGGDTGREEPKTQRRPGATVLPADGGAGGGGGGRQVKLTAKEKESATDGTLQWNYDDPKGKFKKGDPIGVQEFARRKLIMTDEGLYDKTLTAG